MKKQVESIVLENDSGQRLRIYKVDADGPPTFCIGVEGDETEHFEFTEMDADVITSAIASVVDGDHK